VELNIWLLGGRDFNPVWEIFNSLTLRQIELSFFAHVYAPSAGPLGVGSPSTLAHPLAVDGKGGIANACAWQSDTRTANGRPAVSNTKEGGAT